MDGLEDSKVDKMIQERIFVIFGNKYRGELVKSIQDKIRIVDYFILILAWLGGIIAIVSCENNMKFKFFLPDDTSLWNVQVMPTDDEDMKNTVKVARGINTLITFLVIILLIIHYNMYVQYQKMKMNLSPEEGLFSSGYWKYLLLEILLNICHTPPFPEEYSVKVSQRNSALPPAKVFLDNILTMVLLFSRSYHIIKFIAYHSKLNNFDSENICLECSTPLDFLFLIKAEFKSRPFLLVGVVMMVSVFVFGYSVRSIEMFFMFGGDPGKTQDWRYYWNGMWCVIITMSTVGFGDFYPVSILGRAIIVIACFWGTFLISLMVAALTVAVEFNPQEFVSYETIKSAKAEIENGNIGTKLIQTAWRYRNHVKKLREDPELVNNDNFRVKRSTLYIKFRKYWETFRAYRKNENEKIQAFKIELAIKKVDDNLNIEMDKIRLQTPIIDELRNLLDEYENNQDILKQRTIELYKEIEEMSIFKEKFVRDLN
jgi:hypothetical protein